MSNDFLTYDMEYLDIPLQDLPPKGCVLVCHDPQKRLGSVTWTVVVTESANGDMPPKALGLFWDEKIAVMFAEAISEKELCDVR